MAGAVQPVLHQPDPVDVGRLGRQPWASSNTSAESRASRNGVAILLAYGPNRDRLKNAVSPGGGRMRRYGKTFQLTDRA